MVNPLAPASPIGTPRWQVEQVVAVAPSPASIVAAEGLAVPQCWADTGCDARAVWGRCTGGSSEPYDCAIDHVAVRTRCTCASRRRPCKHALALLLLWSRGMVADEVRVSGWRPHWLGEWLDTPAATAPSVTASKAGPGADIDRGASADAGSSDAGSTDVAAPDGDGVDAAGDTPPDGDEAPLDRRARDNRLVSARAGLADFDRWLHDRIRAGLAEAAATRTATWEAAAARLTDAKAGGLANRVRRVAALGATDHGRVLEEVALLHLLVDAAGHHEVLPGALADGVATAVGWQVRQADVLAGVPHTDSWVVMGRSDTREDRIEVRRVWLRGTTSQRWAMVLSFAAYQQSLDESMEVGQCLDADLFRYPGPLGLRALVGSVHTDVDGWASGATPLPVGVVDLAGACREIGEMIAAEPWIDRVPACVLARPVRVAGRWHLTDGTAALPMVAADEAVDVLVASCASGVLPITVEWTPTGLVPLAVFIGDRAVDVGPRADERFVAASPAGVGGGAW